jgi:DNA-binding HxlR family transcriptional regulator
MGQLPAPNTVNTRQDHHDPTRRTIAASPPWKPVTTAADEQPPQAAVIAALQSKQGPWRTRDVRERVNHNRQEPLVNERIYQALVALHQRGLVTRRESPNRHHVYWQLRKTPRATDSAAIYSLQQTPAQRGRGRSTR